MTIFEFQIQGVHEGVFLKNTAKILPKNFLLFNHKTYLKFVVPECQEYAFETIKKGSPPPPPTNVRALHLPPNPGASLATAWHNWTTIIFRGNIEHL